jgi:hypothetical protein
MNGLPPHNAPMALAKESIAMSKQTGDKTFQIMAMVMMAAGGLATLLHAGHVIYRDMTAGRRRDDGPTVRPARPSREEPPEHAAATDHQGSWVHKARVAERASSPKPWVEQAARTGHARQH